MELRFEIEVDILEEAPEVVQNYCGVRVRLDGGPVSLHTVLQTRLCGSGR